MRQQIYHLFWIVLAAGVLFFTQLGSAGLWDEDETIYASCAREMLQRGDWVVPWFNGELFRDKPPLMFWMMMSGYGLFGENEFAARFWSAVLGIATAVATYYLGKLLFRPRVGFWAGLIVASSIIFTVSARAATVDTALTFAITLAVLAPVVGGLGRNDSEGEKKTPVPLMMMVLMYAAIGVAGLAKGPVGILMPVGVLGLYFLILERRTEGGPAVCIEEKETGSADVTWTEWFLRGTRAVLGWFAPRNVLQAVWRMRPFTAVVVVGLVALPWYVWVGLRTDGVWLREFLFKYNLGPAVKPILGHTGPFYYHLLAILIGFFPWSVFLGPTLIHTVRRIRRRHAWQSAYILMACWIGVIVGLWSMVAMKLPHYCLPAYPALALLTAALIDRWLDEPARLARPWMRSATITVMLVGLGIMIAMPVVAAIFLPGEWMLGLVGIILLVGGGLCLWFSERGRLGRALVAFAVMAFVSLTAVFGPAASRVAHYQNAPEIMASLRKIDPDARPEMVSFRFLRQSFVYYLGRPIARSYNPEQLAELLQSEESPYVLTLGEHQREIEEHFPGQFEVVLRRPRFLEPGEVVVLVRRPDADVVLTAEGKGEVRK